MNYNHPAHKAKVLREVLRLQGIIESHGIPIGAHISWDKFNSLPTAARDAQDRLWYIGHHQLEPEKYPI